MALQETALHAPGGLSETDAILVEAQVTKPLFKRWKVRAVSWMRWSKSLCASCCRSNQPKNCGKRFALTQGREVLRREIASTIEKHSGETAQKIAHLVDEYSTERTSWLKGQSETLRRPVGRSRSSG
jgi:hypothetical protein